MDWNKTVTSKRWMLFPNNANLNRTYLWEKQWKLGLVWKQNTNVKIFDADAVKLIRYTNLPFKRC